VPEQQPRTKSVALSVIRALYRARNSILTVAVTYLTSTMVGMVMVHTGSQFAISYHDKIVADAQSSPITNALDRNERLEAALLDFGGNLVAVCSSTLGGLGVVFPYPFMAYRGWIGGIVSLDASHASRLVEPKEARYYLTALMLQLIPSILGAGAGVNLGLSLYRPKPDYRGEQWLGLPKEALRDVLRIYSLVLPLLLIASLWEFGMR